MNKLMLTAALALIATPVMANQADSDAKVEHYFSKMDTNSDGKISMEEHNAFSKRMWDEADANKDGSLSMAEVKEAKMKEKQKMESAYRDSKDQDARKDNMDVRNK